VTGVDEPDNREPAEVAAEARRIWTRLGVALAVLLAGVVAIALLAGGRPVGPGTGTYDAGTTDPLRAALPLLEAYVESGRGLQFHGRVRVSVVDETTLAKLTGKPLSAKAAPATDRAATLATLGLTAPPGPAIPAGTAHGTDAYYSFTGHTIYLLGGQFDAYRRTVLVHELTIALDDQHFGLQRLSTNAAGNADALRALDALIDGDATRIELGYVAGLSGTDQRSVKAAHDYDPPASTYAQNVAAFTVTAGADFVSSLVAAGGNGRVDAAFANPPGASGQILGPKTYLNDQQPYSVREPTSAGTVLDRGSLGQFGLAMVLTDGARYRNVSVLADVQGDTYVTTRAHGKTCVTDSVLLPSDVSRDQLLRTMNAAGLAASRLLIDNSLSFQVCR